MKKNKSNFILAGIFLIGLSLLLYPSISEYWNSLHQSRAISTYVEKVSELNLGEYKEIWDAAFEYNKKLYQSGVNYHLNEDEKKEYNELLNVAQNGVMGYVDIPSIKCSLPIYHGTDEAVLQIAVGHLDWSSLPVGGINTHSIISGHRGLPSARLFTKLDQLVEGDIFMLQILDEVLTYEVDQIRIVLPHEMEALDIVEGEDYCTLVTCTPYGVNTHRLLVRGYRIENLELAESIRVPADALLIDTVIVAPVLAVPILVILFIGLFLYYRKPKRKNSK